MTGADFRDFIMARTGQTKQSNMQNQLGIADKSPKILTIDEFPIWKDKFYNFVMRLDGSLWKAVEEGYQPPLDFQQIPITAIGRMTVPQRHLLEREKKMYNHMLLSLGNRLQHDFKQFKTSKSLWDAMKEKYDEYNASVAKAKGVLIQVDEEVDWSKMSTGCEASCSKTTLEQSSTEHESESDDSSASAESNEESVQV